MKVIWSPLAVERAYEEARYIARDKPGAALRWLDGLFASTDRLAMFPESGSIVSEINDPQYRQIIYRSHRVIYRVEPKRVAILTVRRAKRLLDLAELLQ
ncbi:MAG TPA: type II toxin-antitoxin system RelE/ParE family toxin [Thermoanaerobaculia bacterium]|nr:type II toxin-antitoxin system RelE/ParE family toxin [Thermoanaerobaculia bacterium]